MPHFLVISFTQAFALLMSGLMVWGIVTVTKLNSCLLGETGMCLADAVVLGLMSITAFVFVAFAALLFKSYLD